MFKIKDASYLNPNLFILNVRKGFTQNDREHIDHVTKITDTHYEYINKEGKNYSSSLSSLFENFSVYGFNSQEELDYFKENTAYKILEVAYNDIINGDELSGALKTALFYSFERAKEDLNFRQKLITALRDFNEGQGYIRHSNLGNKLYEIAHT